MARLTDPMATNLEAPRQQGGVPSTPQVTPSGGLARGIEKFGLDIEQGAELIRERQVKEQEKADTTRVEDAWNQYKNAALKTTAGPGGVLTKQGGDAVNGDLMGVATKELSDARRLIGSTLGNDEQKNRFNQRAAATDLLTSHQILSHIDQQNKVYAKTTFDGSVAAAQSQIEAAPTSPDVFAQARVTVMNQTEQYLDMSGVTDQGARDDLKNKVNDSLWQKRIDTLMYNNPILAESLFRANSKEIKNPELRLQLQARTREASMGINATLDAESIVTEVRSRVPPAGTTGPIPIPTEGPTLGANAPRSIRNNNPGNIEKSDVKWAGEVQGDDSRFVRFATWEDGLKAMQQNLLTYQDKYKLDTVEKIISRWAPASENGPSTANYVKTVSEALGVKPGDKINLRDPATMQSMTQAMIQVEAGGSQPGMRNASLETGPAGAPATNGLPSSRDIAAQLPYMLMRVERRADDRFGTDVTNPDRAAYVKKLTSEVHSKVASDVQQLNAIQRQAQGALIDAVTSVTAVQTGDIQQAGGGRAGTPGVKITSFSQIQRDPKLLQQWQLLDPQAKLGIERLMEHNLRENDQGDFVLYRQMWNKIHLKDGDPEKIYFYQQITDPKFADRLSIQQIGQLRLELDRSETPGGRSTNQMRRSADGMVQNWFRTNLQTNINFMEQKLTNPTAYIDWTNRWNEAVGKKVDEYVAAGQSDKVRLMFMPDTPESVISPKYLQTFLGPTSSPAQALSAAADKARTGQPEAPRPVPISTDEEWTKLAPGATFIRDGKVWTKNPAPAGSAPDVSDIRAPMPTIRGPDWQRSDGTPKGTGFLGLLKAAGGKVASEFTIGVPIGGKEMDIPTLVPTLTRAEVDEVLNGKVSDAVKNKAVAHAEQRIREGKSVFAQPGEGPGPAQPPATMSATGKLVPPPAPAVATTAEPQMPTLVFKQTTKERRAATVAAEEIRQADYNARLGESAVTTAKGVGEAAVGIAKSTALSIKAVKAVGEVLTPPSDAEKAAYAFRGILKTGQYAPSSAGTIQDAIDSKLLTPAELKIAQAMLSKLGR